MPGILSKITTGLTNQLKPVVNRLTPAVTAKVIPPGRLRGNPVNTPGATAVPPVLRPTVPSRAPNLLDKTVDGAGALYTKAKELPTSTKVLAGGQAASTAGLGYMAYNNGQQTKQLAADTDRQLKHVSGQVGGVSDHLSEVGGLVAANTGQLSAIRGGIHNQLGSRLSRWWDRNKPWEERLVDQYNPPKHQQGAASPELEELINYIRSLAGKQAAGPEANPPPPLPPSALSLSLPRVNRATRTVSAPPSVPFKPSPLSAGLPRAGTPSTAPTRPAFPTQRSSRMSAPYLTSPPNPEQLDPVTPKPAPPKVYPQPPSAPYVRSVTPQQPRRAGVTNTRSRIGKVPVFNEVPAALPTRDIRPLDPESPAGMVRQSRNRLEGLAANARQGTADMIAAAKAETARRAPPVTPIDYAPRRPDLTPDNKGYVASMDRQTGLLSQRLADSKARKPILGQLDQRELGRQQQLNSSWEAQKAKAAQEAAAYSAKLRGQYVRTLKAQEAWETENQPQAIAIRKQLRSEGLSPEQLDPGTVARRRQEYEQKYQRYRANNAGNGRALPYHQWSQQYMADPDSLPESDTLTPGQQRMLAQRAAIREAKFNRRLRKISNFTTPIHLRSGDDVEPDELNSKEAGWGSWLGGFGAAAKPAATAAQVATKPSRGAQALARAGQASAGIQLAGAGVAATDLATADQAGSKLPSWVTTPAYGTLNAINTVTGAPGRMSNWLADKTLGTDVTPNVDAIRNSAGNLNDTIGDVGTGVLSLTPAAPAAIPIQVGMDVIRPWRDRLLGKAGDVVDSVAGKGAFSGTLNAATDGVYSGAMRGVDKLRKYSPFAAGTAKYLLDKAHPSSAAMAAYNAAPLEGKATGVQSMTASRMPPPDGYTPVTLGGAATTVPSPIAPAVKPQTPAAGLKPSGSGVSYMSKQELDDFRAGKFQGRKS